MPLSWKISHERRIVLAIAAGGIDDGEVQRYLFDLVLQRAFPYAKLFDITGCASALDNMMIRNFASTVRDPEVARAVGPVAIVARNEASRAQALRFAKGAGVDRPIRCFGNGLEARKWLLSVRQVADAGASARHRA
jgi:hypothetical protein